MKNAITSGIKKVAGTLAPRNIAGMVLIILTIGSLSAEAGTRQEAGIVNDSMLFRKYSFLILFDTDRDVAQRFPEEKITKLKEVLGADQHLKLRLEARTDSVGDYFYNKDLALRRMNYTHKKLTAAGIDAGLFLDHIYGEDFPLRSNESVEGRQTNRSVKVSAGYFLPTEEVSGRLISGDDGGGLAGTLIINSRYYRDTFELDSTGFFAFPMAQSAAFSMEFYSSDHILERTFINLARQTSVIGDFEVKKLKAGDIFNFEDILFVTNQAVLMPQYRDALPRLLQTIRAAADYRFEIQGHVNNPYDPPQPKGTFYYDLSERRARMVYSFLIDSGIDSSRLEWNAYSNWKMIYPRARSEHQMRFNRRVAIKVLGKIDQEKLK